LIHSSGSSIVADLAMGEPSDRIFHEGTPIERGRQSSRTPIRPLVSRSTGWCSVLPASAPRCSAIA
jgi:hypothetical protein